MEVLVYTSYTAIILGIAILIITLIPLFLIFKYYEILDEIFTKISFIS